MPDEKTEENRFEWICGTIDVDGGARAQGAPTDLVPMGTAAMNKLWDRGTTLNVAFLDGEVALHQRVLLAASHWIVPGVKLKFEAASRRGAADIRIAFNKNSGSWSNIGTDARSIHPSQPTMNLGWATLEAPDARFLGTVIHEFGHALGLLHEHNHPGARIRWNEDEVYRDLEGPPNSWSREKIDRNVFASYSASEVITTNFDNISVMIYTIPSHWTKDGKSFMPSSKLSDGDVATIVKLYS